MSVVIETTLGDITVDLYLEQRPITCLNFIKLCKMKYYNFNLFHSIRSGFIAQTGDPTGTGSGGQSVFGVLGGPQKRFFSGEKMPRIRHTDTGLLSMVCTDDMMVGSQFFFTLSPDLDSLDGVHCVIGEVTEGHDVLRKLNDVICDDAHRPYRDVRITHTVILEDPFTDPVGFRAPSRSPSPSAERLSGGRIAPDEEIDETQGKSVAEIHEILQEKEAQARATILEIIGDLPDADIAPPENVLFVCKLNPVTTDEDLEIIFSRFGKIVSCEVIRDKKTGDSLQYAFIEFSDKKSCENAYFKMDNVLIDDRRIHVDFSQSVSKIKWLGKGRGVKHINDENNHTNNDHSNRLKNKERHYNNGRDYDSNRESKNDNRRYEDKRHRDKHCERIESNEKTKHNRERSRSKRDKLTEKPKDDEIHNEKKNEHNKQDSYKKKEDSHKSRHLRNIDKLHISKDNKVRNYEMKEQKAEGKCQIFEIAIENNKRKMTHNKEERLDKQNKRNKSDQASVEPRTPSPIKEKKDGNLKRKKIKKIRESKKKRKPSTSSSDTDSSTSSNQSSSSSEQDKKKKKLKIKKRKYSTSSSSSSSSSSDSSSSSTTSSSSSSSSTSSDSENEKRNKRKKTASRKGVSKTKKKYR